MGAGGVPGGELEPGGQLRLALEAAGMGAWHFTAASKRVRLDARLQQLYGIEPGAFDGSMDSWSRLVHPEDRQRVLMNLDRALRRGSGSFRQEYRVEHADGAIHWLEGRGEVYLDEELGVCARGVTSDVTARKENEAELSRSRDRLKVLADAGHVLSESLQLDDTLRTLGSLVVPHLADACEIDLLDGERFRRFVISGDAEQSTLREMTDVPDIEGHPIRRVLATGRAEVLLLSESPDAFGPADVPTTARALGIVAAVLVPIIVHGRPTGVFAMSWRSEPVDIAERAQLAHDLAARAGLACENVRLFARQRDMSIEMQRALLPDEVVAPPGFRVAAGYRPGALGLEVGGDWYDTALDASGRLHLSVGDVVGKGISAAATMVRARIALRSLMIDRTPDVALEALRQSRNVRRSGYVTVLAATIEPNGSAMIATAGHPPPLVVRRDGAVEVMSLPINPPLGVPVDRPILTKDFHLDPGSRLVMFTDGLVERRHEIIDAGIERLARVLAAHHDHTPDDLVQIVLDDMLAAGGDDDAAVLILDRLRMDGN